MASREEEEISELQEDDRDQFSDQLASVGMLGRVAAEHCIPLLTRYTQSREPTEQFSAHPPGERFALPPARPARWSTRTDTHSWLRSVACTWEPRHHSIDGRQIMETWYET